jgi:SAM-dependent methyltransferase
LGKRKRVSPEDELLASLALLEERRRPYAELLAGVVGDTLARFPPADGGPLVEIGAGTGLLRAWLPAALAARAVHTDPSARALAGLRARAPEAQVATAAAGRLPFDGGACAGALALCVFDAIHAARGEEAAVAELGRVLAPGARFVHFLDMATLLEAPFEKLAASALVPLPNLFGDPSDHPWPLDVVLVKRDWLAGVLELARRAGHPLPTTFGRFLGAFLGERFDVTDGTNQWKAVASSGPRRRELHGLLLSASALAERHGHPPLRRCPFIRAAI